MRGARIKFGGLLVAVALGLWSLYPTYRLYFVMPVQEKALADRLVRAQTADDSVRIQVQLYNMWNQVQFNTMNATYTFDANLVNQATTTGKYTNTTLPLNGGVTIRFDY